ncbi:hypothetical protein HHK36_011090 [Tetracentron sinense]|uniref:Uncharacterized protein n=1 Tax=Tetracentron sinense TaxID=13715 RepID=A0A834ZFK1_TETSI|nr:hypothetical protein HHK36_011090 [Tetracentron sinense]
MAFEFLFSGKLGFLFWGFLLTTDFYLTGSFSETQHGEVTFPEISTTILEKICQYFYWSLQFARFSSFSLLYLISAVSTMIFASRDFVFDSFRGNFYLILTCCSVASGKETEFHIEPELTLELMMAANYLHT